MATHLKAHRTAASLLKKGLYPAASVDDESGLNSNILLSVLVNGKPVAMVLTEGQASDYKGAAILLDQLPPAKDIAR